MANGASVVTLLKNDHERAEHLFERLDATDDEKLEEYLCEVRELLVRHEVAEELVVYPAFRSAEPSQDDVADARIAEQSEAEEQLARLESEHDPGALRAGMVELRAAVLEHAEKEESEVFPALEHDLDGAALAELGERYEHALASAPTHPHPHAPDTPPGNVIAGPIAAYIDKMRDAMRR